MRHSSPETHASEHSSVQGLRASTLLLGGSCISLLQFHTFPSLFLTIKNHELELVAFPTQLAG